MKCCLEDEGLFRCRLCRRVFPLELREGCFCKLCKGC